MGEKTQKTVLRAWPCMLCHFPLERKLQTHSPGLAWQKSFRKKFRGKNTPLRVERPHVHVLRPLAGVDMQLQRNKVQNLRLAAKQIDGVDCYPRRNVFIVGSGWRADQAKRIPRRAGHFEGPLRKGSCWRIVPACQFNPLYGFTYADESDRTASPYRRTFSGCRSASSLWNGNLHCL